MNRLIKNIFFIKLMKFTFHPVSTDSFQTVMFPILLFSNELMSYSIFQEPNILKTMYCSHNVLFYMVT